MESEVLCNRCGEIKLSSEFPQVARESRGWQQPCKVCCAAYQKQLRLNNPIKHRARKYKVTEEEMAALLSKELCDLCGKPMQRKCVDHHHDTGKVRGILCNGCNVGLGSFQDSAPLLRKAAEYLEKHCGS